jgi:hypothetical protein
MVWELEDGSKHHSESLDKGYCRNIALSQEEVISGRAKVAAQFEGSD